MYYEAFSSVEDGPRLIVRNALSAVQWEAFGSAARPAGHASWLTPSFVPLPVWLRATWNELIDLDDRRVVLTPRQSAALWRDVIATSADTPALLEQRSVARWAADARRTLLAWGIDPRGLRADPGHAEFRVFLAWHRRYTETLRSHGWLDDPAVTADLATRPLPPGQTLALIDVHELSPSERAILDACTEGGGGIERHDAPVVACLASQTVFADAESELAAALEFAVASAERHDTRIAVVTALLRDDPGLVERCVADARGASPQSGGVPVWLAATPPPGRGSLVGAALAALALGSDTADFTTLSRWLRSPHFRASEADRGGAAALEATLREWVGAQLPLRAALERAGLAERMASAASGLALSLTAGLEELRGPGARARPDVWAGAWARGLEKLGWLGARGGTESPVSAWDEALASFAELTPVVGTLPASAAIAELESILGAPGPARDLPIRGVHVLSHIDDVGPGYEAVWVTGISDRSWPPPAMLNPLLPLRLQRAHGMPGATPGDARARARDATQRLMRRTRTAIFSRVRTAFGCETEPSPVLAELGVPERPELERAFASGATARRPRIERIADPAPALAARRVPGGARTLDLQARCPVRAFGEARLKASSLEVPALGLGSRMRGIAVHRALERLLTSHPSREELETHCGAGSAECRTHATASLRATFGGAERALQHLFDLELDRLEALLGRFVESELLRPAFRLVAAERGVPVLIGAHEIVCRIDRIDEEVHGGLVVIDYKSGPTPPRLVDWTRAPLLATQLPLYALGVGAGVCAALTASVSPRSAAYVGVETADEEPSMAGLRTVPPSEWAALIATWRAELERLTAEFAGGDTRMYLDDTREAQGSFAPLTRVFSLPQAFESADPS